MTSRTRRLTLILALLAAVAVGIGLWRAQRREVDHAPPLAAYSARIVRTVVTGNSHLVTESRVFRMNDLVREDWTEMNERRSVIWRPDLGKVFLLLLEERAYSESDIFGAGQAGLAPGTAVDPYEIDLSLGAGSPAKIETVAIGSRTIDGHPCEGSERKLTFPSGHVEVTRTFRARDLGGLPLRAETFTEAPSGLPRITIEVRDISTDVRGEVFEVPPGFTRTVSRGIGAPPGAWR